MTFTYDLTGGFTDLTRVRFHVGDTTESAAIFSDEEISAIVTEAGSWQAAVCWCFENIIAKLLQEPDFQADWLKVEASKAVALYEKRLAAKRAEFGIGRQLSVSAGHTYRADSRQTQEPDYTNGTDGNDDWCRPC